MPKTEKAKQGRCEGCGREAVLCAFRPHYDCLEPKDWTPFEEWFCEECEKDPRKTVQPNIMIMPGGNVEALGMLWLAGCAVIIALMYVLRY